MISLEDANMRRKFGFAAQILRAFESADAVVLLGKPGMFSAGFDLPTMAGIDTPVESELPAFVDRLEAGLRHALNAAPPDDQSAALGPFTWSAVFKRVEHVWRSEIDRAKAEPQRR